jgi:hypothetical protein
VAHNIAEHSAAYKKRFKLEGTIKSLTAQNRRDMRLVFPLLLVAILTATAQSQTYEGKTRNQILKMGQIAWFDYYLDRRGEKLDKEKTGTLKMQEMQKATILFGNCLRKRNEELLTKLAAPTRERLKNRHEKGSQIARLLFQVESRNGGTLDKMVAAENYVRKEEVLYAMIRASQAPTSSSKVEEVKELWIDIKRNFQSIDRTIRREPEVIRTNKVTKKQILEWLLKAYQSFTAFSSSAAAPRLGDELELAKWLQSASSPANFSKG